MLLQAALGVLGALSLYLLSPDFTRLKPYIALLSGFWLTYMVVAPVIPKFFRKTGDTFYLVFLGISGIRFLFYIGILTIILLFRPEVKSVSLALTLTAWFVTALVVEMMVFMSNLRHISKNRS